MNEIMKKRTGIELFERFIILLNIILLSSMLKHFLQLFG
jgi:hypothetical protein